MMVERHWSVPFIGLPFADKGRTPDGVDCWGLVRLVFASRGIELPSYAEGYVGVAERAEIAALFSEQAAQEPWRPVLADDAREFDVALFRRAGMESHVGVVIERGRMLHVASGIDSCIERYCDGRWAPKLLGIYRHADMDA